MSSVYKNYSLDEIQELESNFIISSWSYSKVAAFSRNEKAFEMAYIYGVKSRRSATTIAGEAYHEALAYFFNQYKEGKTLDLVELEAAAFQYIDGIPANVWKIQKTTPTVDDCIAKATKTTVSLLRNFIKEVDVYLADIAEILDVEIRHDGYLTVNGVDIPLPCHGKLDLRVRLKTGGIAIMDHKSKTSFTPEEEIALSIGRQAITYALLAEDATGEPVSEIRFVENKYSENKNGGPQLAAFRVELDPNTRALYEALLYEPLRRMIDAVSDPDYVYLINDDDNFVDRAELYDHWARTMIAEVTAEDFNVEAAKKDLVEKRLRKIRDASISAVSPNVIKKFKDNAAAFIQYDLTAKNMTNEQKIEHALRSFGAIVRVAHTLNGYSSDTYLLEISAGVKLTSVLSHRLDLANALNVEDVRVASKLTVYQGASYLAVEVSKKREKNLDWTTKDLDGHRIPVGRSNADEVIFWDLDNNSTPHVLVCGATGSGKSVWLRSTIEFTMAAGVQDVIIFDPKYEFGKYFGQAAIVNEIEEIEIYLAKLVLLMNERVRTRKSILTLVIFDEFADAVSQSMGAKLPETILASLDEDVRNQVMKGLEENLRILLQKGRSSGFRIIAATQRASVKVISGDAKVNFPVQVCFRVPKEVDSKVVLDEGGAESLAGGGDGLIKSPDYRDTVRFQAYFSPA